MPSIILKNNYILSLLRVLLGCMFLFSGAQKLLVIQDFFNIINKIQFISYDTAVRIGSFIIFIEIIIGASLLLGIYISYFFKIAFALLVCFSIYLFTVLLQGVETDGCGCFGKLSNHSNPIIDIARNILLLIILLLLINKNKQCDLYSIDAFTNNVVRSKRK